MARLVTVFGGSGFVGSQVVRSLARRGWRIRVAVRSPHQANELLPLGDVGQIQLMGCDVTDADRVLAALDGADAAVNLVGALNSNFDKVHVHAARYIADACVARGITRLVQVSAIGADARSAAAYARTKAQAEEIIKKAVPSATILRPSIVFGPGDGFFERFAAMAALSPVLPLIGGGKTRFAPVYVGDVAQAVARVLEDPACPGQTYELGGPRVYSFKDLMQMVLTQTNRTRILAPLPFFAARGIALGGDVMAGLGLNPPITSGQVIMLGRDNVPAPGAKGLADLGIEPVSVEAIVPSYLWRYRRGGQFAEAATA